MNNYPADLLAAAADPNSTAIDLVEFSAWAGATLRFARWDRPVTWAGNVYLNRTLTIEGLEHSLEGRASPPTLRFSNHDLAFTKLIRAASPIGAKVRLLRILREAPTQAQVYAAALKVDAYTLGEWVTFTLCYDEPAGKDTFPARICTPLCTRTFRAPDCGYAGPALLPDDACDHTAATCADTYNRFPAWNGFNFVTPKEY